MIYKPLKKLSRESQLPGIIRDSYLLLQIQMSLDVNGSNANPGGNIVVLLPISLMGIGVEFQLCDHYTLADFAFNASLVNFFATGYTIPVSGFRRKIWRLRCLRQEKLPIGPIVG